MRLEGIYAKSARKFKHRRASLHLKDTENLLTQDDLVISYANQVWYSDITQIRTQEGWLYLAAVMDAYSKRIVGYAMAEHMRTDLVIQALRMARKQRRPSSGLIHHSDRGSQYTSYAYRRELTVNGFRASFTQAGACLDNAYIESFFATLKKELVYDLIFGTREEAKAIIFEYINAFYNNQRLHSSLDYQSPAKFETNHMLEKLAA